MKYIKVPSKAKPKYGSVCSSPFLLFDTELHLFLSVPQETVLIFTKVAGGTTRVPTPTSTGCGTEEATTGASIRMEYFGLSTGEVPTP